MHPTVEKTFCFVHHPVWLLFLLRMCLVVDNLASRNNPVMGGPAMVPISYQVTLQLLLLLSGDVETNPGPPTGRISVAKGPSAEEQVYTLNTQVYLTFVFLGE